MARSTAPGVEPTIDTPSLVAPWMLWATLLLIPLVAYLYVLIAYHQTYLMRRDENIMLAIFAELRRGRPLNQIFTMIITPSFLASLRAVGAGADPLLAGRLLAMLSALACAALTALIGRRLFPARPIVALLAVALLFSSVLFIAEGTIFRLNLLSLALGLAAVWLLLGLSWERRGLAALTLVVVGLCGGLALQVKPLVLTLAPTLAWLSWRAAHQPAERPSLLARLLLVGGLQLPGWVGPTLLAGLLGGPGGSRLDQQLGAHLTAFNQADLALRVSHAIGTTWAFAIGHSWLIIFFVWACLRGRGAPTTERPALRQLGLWAGATLAVLLVNFPSWDHHYTYLLPPLAIGAALLLDDLALALGGSLARQTPFTIRSPQALIALSLTFSGVFGAVANLQAQTLTPTVRAVAQLISERTPAEAIIWTDELAVDLLADRASDPALIDLSIKRILAGRLTEADLVERFSASPPTAVVAMAGLFDAFPRFMGCLGQIAELHPIAPGNLRIYWVRAGAAPALTTCMQP